MWLFMRFGPFFYDKCKARQEKMFTFTLKLYCTSKSCKIQVAKVATKQKLFLVAKEENLVALATILVAIWSPA